jgi:hypothetical protein
MRYSSSFARDILAWAYIRLQEEACGCAAGASSGLGDSTLCTESPGSLDHGRTVGGRARSAGHAEVVQRQRY